MSDIWSHSHEWDNGYCKGHKDGYQQGRADAISEREEYWNMQNHKAYEQGRNDAIEALKEKYLDADAYNEGLADGRADTITEIEKVMHEAYKGTSHQWECMIFDLKIRELKEQKNE